jgi:hypothetical protein
MGRLGGRKLIYINFGTFSLITSSPYLPLLRAFIRNLVQHGGNNYPVKKG